MSKIRPQHRTPDRLLPYTMTTIGAASVHRLAIDGAPWLIAVEVCQAVGYAPPGDGSVGPYLRHLLPDERRTFTMPGPVGPWRRGQRVWLVSPAGAFKVAVRGLYGAVIDGQPTRVQSLLEWLAGQQVPTIGAGGNDPDRLSGTRQGTTVSPSSISETQP